MTEDLHRKFGVEGNNETWRLLDAGAPGPDATEEERARMLYRAFSSAYHWMEAPTANAANRARAEHLIARAAIAVEQPGLGLRHAQLCLALCDENRDVVEDWDFAFAHEAIARAYAAGGDAESSLEHHAIASGLGAEIADEDDRDVFLAELARGPWFGVVGS